MTVSSQTSRFAGLFGVVLCLLLIHPGLADTVGVSPFGETPDGKQVQLYTLTSKQGMVVEVMDYGATITRMLVPDRDGQLADVVLGFNTLDEYVEDSPYFGCVVGRVGNRIAGGRFSLNGKKYRLAKNNEPAGIACTLHGGKTGFDKVVWRGRPVFGDGKTGVRFQYLSPDKQEGFPGNLKLNLTYWLTDKNELRIESRATTDKATPVNLAFHSYFNLKGEGIGDVLDHLVTINASHFTPVNAGMIPTGEIRPVEGTPFDFLAAHPLGERIGADDEQLELGKGYDHNWVINPSEKKLTMAASVLEKTSGRILNVLTSEPGIQFYTGNFLDGHHVGKSGVGYDQRSGFCLETQHFPDSPNQPDFPSVILNPEDTYRSTTVYRFKVSKK